jgi:hypothetical protein
MIETITVTHPAMLRKLGFEYPMPSYISGSVSLILRWLINNNPDLSQAHQTLAEIIMHDFNERKKSHSVEARIVQQRDDYVQFKQIHASY